MEYDSWILFSFALHHQLWISCFRVNELGDFCEILFPVYWCSIILRSWAESDNKMSMKVTDLSAIDGQMDCQQLQIHNFDVGGGWGLF